MKEQLRAVPNRGIGYGVLRHLAAVRCGGSWRRRARPDVVFNYLGQYDQTVSEDAFFAFAAE